MIAQVTSVDACSASATVRSAPGGAQQIPCVAKTNLGVWKRGHVWREGGCREPRDCSETVRKG